MELGVGGSDLPAVPNNDKEKNNKPSKELPLGFVDRQEKELLVRDFIISNIKSYGQIWFSISKHQVLSIQKVLENFTR